MHSGEKAGTGSDYKPSNTNRQPSLEEVHNAIDFFRNAHTAFLLITKAFEAAHPDDLDFQEETKPLYFIMQEISKAISKDLTDHDIVTLLPLFASVLARAQYCLIGRNASPEIIREDYAEFNQSVDALSKEINKRQNTPKAVLVGLIGTALTAIIAVMEAFLTAATLGFYALYACILERFLTPIVAKKTVTATKHAWNGGPVSEREVKAAADSFRSLAFFKPALEANPSSSTATSEEKHPSP